MHRSPDTLPLQLEQHDEPDAVVVVARGEVEVSTAAALRSRLEQLGGTTRRVVLDMAQVSFLDSSGLGCLIAAQRSLRSDFCELSVRDPSIAVRRVLDISGLSEELVGHRT